MIGELRIVTQGRGGPVLSTKAAFPDESFQPGVSFGVVSTENPSFSIPVVKECKTPGSSMHTSRGV
jgi:hypothetical protein